MSLGGNQRLAREVASAIEEWNPTKAYDHESKFQNELQEYLDKRLNTGGNSIDPNQQIVVEREHGTVNGDVVVNGTIGIEMKRNLTNSQTKKLRGQIEEYRRAYSHVIVVACGIDDMDGWRKLRNDYENQMGMDVGPDNAPVKFIHKRKSNYGTDERADTHRQGGATGQDSVDAEELVQMVEEGMTGYKSLSGDGPMDTPEAVIAVGRAVVLIGFILAIAGIVLFNVVL